MTQDCLLAQIVPFIDQDSDVIQKTVSLCILAFDFICLTNQRLQPFKETFFHEEKTLFFLFFFSFKISS